MSRSRNRAQNPPAQKVARARTDGANPCSKHKDARTRKERLGNLSKGVFQRRTSTGRGLFTFLSSGFAQIFSQIVSTSVKKLSNTHFIASRHIKREKSSLPVDVRRSKALYFLWASRSRSSLPCSHLSCPHANGCNGDYTWACAPCPHALPPFSKAPLLFALQGPVVRRPIGV